MQRYLIPIAEHFAEMEDYVNAERFYLQAKRPNDAVMMYTKARQWELAHKVATTFMSSKEIWDLYINQAKTFESRGQFKDAERLYINVQEHDLAINMYKNNRQYDNMIKLVSIYHKDLLGNFYLFYTSGYSYVPSENS
jgi:intraflagellar transport protein 172